MRVRSVQDLYDCLTQRPALRRELEKYLPLCGGRQLRPKISLSDRTARFYGTREEIHGWNQRTTPDDKRNEKLSTHPQDRPLSVRAGSIQRVLLMHASYDRGIRYPSIPISAVVENFGWHDVQRFGLVLAQATRYGSRMLPALAAGQAVHHPNTAILALKSPS